MRTLARRRGGWLAGNLAVAVPLLSCLAGGAPPQLPQSPQPFVVSVNVDLVVLDATVRDKKGSAVTDLTAQEFAVYEDGVRQTIRLFRNDDIPVTVGLVVDHSGSMRQKLTDVIAASGTFVRFSSPADEMFVVNFNEKISLGLPESIPFTHSPEELEKAVSNIPATGMTALYDAVDLAQERLRAGSRDKKVLVVISDGGDNASKHTLAEMLKTAGGSAAQVYTIGIFDVDDADRNPDVLRRLAAVTGGEAFFPKKIDEVVAICESIARDIRHQYTIGYVSSNAPKPGAFRAIQVTARGPGNTRLVVRTRSGYFAGEPGAAKEKGSK